MLKFLWSLARSRSIGRPQPQDDEEIWRRDPLAHPALQAMSERELADLPLAAGFNRVADRSQSR